MPLNGGLQDRTSVYEERNIFPDTELFWGLTESGKIPRLIDGKSRNYIFRSILHTEDNHWRTYGKRRGSLPKYVRRQGRFAREFSTPVGCSLEKHVLLPDPETKTFHHHYQQRTCDDLKCGGTIRYDKNGFAVCDSCGLVHDEQQFLTEARFIREDEREDIESNF